MTLTSRLTVGKELSKGINISGSTPFGSKLIIHPHLFMAYQTIINSYSGSANVNSLRLRGNINGSYGLNQNISMELFGFYNSAINNV